MALSQTLSTKIPNIIYGTAWKKEKTCDLVYQALRSGFRGIDTAAQPRHYQEHLVGEGIRKAISDGLVTREEIYVRGIPYIYVVWLKDADSNQIHASLRAGPEEYAL